MGFLLQSAVIAMVVCSAKVSADVNVNYDRKVFEQAVTQVRNEESSAVEAMNAKLIDLQNGCRQDSKSALRFCNACSLQFALIGCPKKMIYHGGRAYCRSCPLCDKFLGSNNQLLSSDEIKTNVCGPTYLKELNEGAARTERLSRYINRFDRSGAQVLQQLWTNGNRVSKLVILEENGSHKTSNVKTTIIYNAANQIPALLAIARKILYQTY